MVDEIILQNWVVLATIRVLEMTETASQPDIYVFRSLVQRTLTTLAFQQKAVCWVVTRVWWVHTDVSEEHNAPILKGCMFNDVHALSQMNTQTDSLDQNLQPQRNCCFHKKLSCYWKYELSALLKTYLLNILHVWAAG